MSWLPELPDPVPTPPPAAEDLVRLADDLRRLLDVDRLWLRLTPGLTPGLTPATGATWVGPSGVADGRTRDRLDELDRSAEPGPIPRASLPDGWRAGLHVPLRGPGERDAGSLLIGWTRRTARYRASRALSGKAGQRLAAAARIAGAFRADAGTAERERERSRLRAIVDHCDIALMGVEDGHVVVWNTAMTTLSGTPADKALGRRPRELFTLTAEDGTPVDLADTPQGTVRLTTRDGRALWARVSCTAASDLLTAVFVDESAQRQLEEMHSLLLASARHELRGSLTTIRGHAQLLEEILPSGEENVSDSLGAIQDAEETVRRIVEDLVPLTGTDPTVVQTTTIETIDVASLLKRTLRSVPSTAARTTTTVQPGLVVRGDRVRLRQCLLIVLGNAEKYAPGGRIDITACAEGASGVISVRDEGPGIPAGEREAALRPYHRSRAARRLPGAGLGLYIADAAMTAMHGRIELASAPSGGLDVRLHLPLATRTRHGEEETTGTS